MARLVVNGKDFSTQLIDFEMKCKKCGSNKVTLDIDWAAYPSDSWCDISLICDACKHDEEICYD